MSAWQAVDLGAPCADHDAGAGGSDEDPDLVALALDVDREMPARVSRERTCLRIQMSSCRNWAYSRPAYQLLFQG
jgi:hypothetical protein